MVFYLWNLDFLKILHVAQDNWSGPNQMWSNFGQNWPSEAMQFEPSFFYEIWTQYVVLRCLNFGFLPIKLGLFKNSTCCLRVLEWPKSSLVEVCPKFAIWGHAVRAKSTNETYIYVYGQRVKVSLTLAPWFHQIHQSLKVFHHDHQIFHSIGPLISLL